MYTRKSISPTVKNLHFTESFLKKYNDLAGLPSKHFELFYTRPIQEFLKLTRHCENQDLHDHLNAVDKSMRLRRSVILPLHCDAESINKSKDLWTYAIFIGSLMYNAQTLIFKHILIKDAQASDFKKWSPFDSPINDNEQVEVLSGSPVSKYATNLITPLIFSSQCLIWLMRDQNAFNTAITLSHSPELSDLGYLVIDAHLKRSNEMSQSEQTDPNTENCAKKISFRKWLKLTIQENKCENFIDHSENGVTVANPDIFVEYSKKFKNDSWQHVRDTFFKLKLHGASAPVIFSNGLIKKAFIIEDIENL